MKTDLSPQELINCAREGHNNKGCGGGLMDRAYKYVMGHGISTLDDYPYIGKDDKCKGRQNSGKINVTGITV